MRTLLFAMLSASMLGCGGGPATITVASKTLMVKEQNYGMADYYCDNLARGEFQVIISDIEVCDLLSADGGNVNAFHKSESSHLRMIFPSTLTVVPKVNTFTVGISDCVGSKGPDTQAIAFFSHSDGTNPTYTVNQPAGSGKINVTDYDKTANRLKSDFDLNFPNDHVTGKFDALFCKSIVPGTGK